MADTTYCYEIAFKQFLGGGFDLVNDTIKCALLTSAYSVDYSLHQYWSDISSNEVSGIGYTAGGQALTGKVVTRDDATDTITFDADDVTWSTATITDIRYAILYKDTGTASTSPLLSCTDLGASYSPTAENFTIQFPATGVLQFQSYDTGEYIHNIHLYNCATGAIDMIHDNIYLAILDSSLTDDVDLNYFSDVQAYENSGSGYTPGGYPLQNRAWDYGGPEYYVTMDPITINNITMTNAKFYCLYKNTGDPSTSPIIGVERLSRSGINTYNDTFAEVVIEPIWGYGDFISAGD